MARARRAPGSGSRGFPQSRLTWAGAVRPLLGPAGVKPSCRQLPGSQHGRPARAPCGSAACPLGWERALEWQLTARLWLVLVLQPLT